MSESTYSLFEVVAERNSFRAAVIPPAGSTQEGGPRGKLVSPVKPSGAKAVFPYLGQ